jgi:hypothetical protein
VNEDFAQLLFSGDEGERVSDSVRKVVLPGDDPRIKQLGRVQSEVEVKEGRLFVYSTYLRRYYSRRELETAGLLHALVGEFEPAGEQCGTVYDESTACPVCGAGATQVGDLILDLRKAPKRWEIAATIADEWVLTQRVAELMLDADMKGFELRPVHHKARYEDDPVNFEDYSSGRELLRRAEEANSPYPSWAFWVWLNRSEQGELLESMGREHAERAKLATLWRPRHLPLWYQLIVTSQPIAVSAQTRFGNKLFDDGPADFRCPFGHVKGGTILSEPFVRRDQWDGSDVVKTKEMIGTRSACSGQVHYC